MDREITRIINDRLKGYKVVYKGISNKEQIVISTTEVTIFVLSWVQKQKGSTVIKSLLNGIASENQLITFTLILDNARTVPLKHGVASGDHNISFSELYNVSQGVHKLEVKAVANTGTFTIDVNNCRQVVIT